MGGACEEQQIYLCRGGSSLCSMPGCFCTTINDEWHSDKSGRTPRNDPQLGDKVQFSVEQANGVKTITKLEKR
jgi:hypothetical protein